MATVAELVTKTRDLVSDALHEGNTVKYDPDQVLWALNLAQARLAELTHCTYTESPTTIDANGFVDLSADDLTATDIMRVDRVRADEPTTDPDATITAPDTGTLLQAIEATIPDQVDATYLWSVAGGVLETPRTQRVASVKPYKLGKLFLVCLVVIHGDLARGAKTITISA